MHIVPEIKYLTHISFSGVISISSKAEGSRNCKVHSRFSVFLSRCLCKKNLFIYLFLNLRWDFGYCGHYWPIVPVPDDR
jgi:hypothetical protein